MLKRVVTAVILILTISAAIAVQGWPLRILLMLGMFTSVYEVYRAFEHRGDKPAKWVGYIYCVLAILAQGFYLKLNEGVFTLISPTLLSLVACTLLGMIAIVLRGKADFDSLVATVFPMLYPGIFYVLILPLQDLDSRLVSTVALVLTFFIASVSDTFALFGGMLFGRHKLSPEISPKKTVEGAVCGLVSSIVFAVLVPVIANWLCSAVPSFSGAQDTLPSLWLFALLGLVAGVVSQFGDLTASLIKRHCGIKDYGTIFPGHGGMMDRMDGVLFCGAVCYVFFRLTGM